MDDREKLVELLKQCSCAYTPPCTSECSECGNVEMYDDEIAKIADHLIVNGVTVQRWIPVAERLPEDGAEVLCWYEYFRYGEYNRMHETFGIGYQFNGNWGGEVSHGTKTRVLYWMPLPEPPKEGE